MPRAQGSLRVPPWGYRGATEYPGEDYLTWGLVTDIPALKAITSELISRHRGLVALTPLGAPGDPGTPGIVRMSGSSSEASRCRTLGSPVVGFRSYLGARMPDISELPYAQRDL